MIEISLLALIERLGEKAGKESTCEFLAKLGNNLAGRMGIQQFRSWSSFNTLLLEERTIINLEGKTRLYLERQVTNKKGDVIGYIYTL
jgi:Fe-S cluster biosynthesis and repair protein YggX